MSQRLSPTFLLRLLVPMLGLWPALALGQTVRVSKTSQTADETTIQAAIASLAPGGSRDDGNVNNNVVQIEDGEVYREALRVDGFGITIEGTGPTRPRIITSSAQAAANPNGFAVRVDTDQAVTLRRLVFLPDANDPPFGGFTFDEFTDSAGRGYTVTFEDVLVAGNAGNDQPCSTDGRTPPPAGTVRYQADVLDFNSTPTNSNSRVVLRRTILTGASGGTGALVRVFTDNGTAEIGEGCVFSWSNGGGVLFSAANNMIVEWLGTAAAPILVHGCNSYGIRNNTASARAFDRFEHVAVTRNALTSDVPGVLDSYTGTALQRWRNVTVASNATQSGTFPASGPLDFSSRISMVNCIVAGDGGEGPRTARNLIVMRTGAQLTVDGTCIDLSHGGTSLNVAWQRAAAQAITGIDGGSAVQQGVGLTGLSPQFRTFDPADPGFLVVGNPAFQKLGPNRTPLTGAGRIEPFPFTPINTLTGDLQAYLEGVPIPVAASTDKFRQPTADELLVFRSAVDDIIRGRFQAAANKAGLVNYDLIVYRDTPRSRDVAVLRERENANTAWGGVYAFALAPQRKLVTESPHPLFDGTRVQAIDLFFRTASMAFMQSGTHRNNSPELSPCDGTQSSGEPYRLSDMAHNSESFFQAAHEQLHRHHTDTISLSVHGMAATSDPSDLVMSNGTSASTSNPSLSRSVAQRMNQILTAQSDSRYAVSHQEPGESPALSGSTNTQGRYVNGSHRPCTLSASALFPERFLHMEQAPSVRNGPPSLWDFVVTTYNDLIAEFPAVSPAPPEGGNLLASFPLDGDLTPETGQDPGDPIGAVNPAADRFGRPAMALRLDNAGYATIPEFPYMGPDYEFSLSFWFRATSTGTGFQYMVSHGSIGANGEVTLPHSLHIYLVGDTGQVRSRFTLGNGRRWNFDGPLGLGDGAWHFFALTMSATQGAAIYIDGQPVGTDASHRLASFEPEGTIFLGARSDLLPARFMAHPGGQPAFLDGFALHDAALTAGQVLALFQEAPPVTRRDAWQVQ
ncbi:MAG: LamG domain-containing protein [Candidatus Sumerlaeia bacterium]|nr:LamG domain-containing protein [Candidatus Sumerlaeia bacterium]